MTTTNQYLQLSQLAADFRRRGMTETADLVDREHEAIGERFGPLEAFRIPPRAPWLDEYTRRLRQYRSRAETGDQYGRVNHAVALACTITLSLLAQAVREGLQLTPRDAEQITDTVRRATDAAFQRIENFANAEAGKARFVQQHNVKLKFNQAVKEQERAAAEAAVVAARSRLAALAR